MKPARWHELLVLNTYWLGLSFMWNGLHVIILPPCCSTTCRQS